MFYFHLPFRVDIWPETLFHIFPEEDIQIVDNKSQVNSDSINNNVRLEQKKWEKLEIYLEISLLTIDPAQSILATQTAYPMWYVLCVMEC